LDNGTTLGDTNRAFALLRLGCWTSTPEVVADERDEHGKTHYDRVRDYYRTHQITNYDLTDYYNRNDDRLTEPFYKGDRSMRESEFDPSNRFGQFNADILNYNPFA
jgi:alpha,alpha-trehalase